VQRIERLFNPRLQEKYLAEVQDIAGLCSQKVSPLPDGSRHTAFIPSVETFNNLKLNEFLLYHGAPSNLIERLCLQGLDPLRAGTNFGKLFGAGVYLAANSSKSDIYTTESDNQERCVLVVRTCLGEAYAARQRHRDYLMPPERPDGKGALNSVVALTKNQGGVVEHSEYIIYQSAQCLPQYAIWYKHSDSCECTHCL